MRNLSILRVHFRASFRALSFKVYSTKDLHNAIVVSKYSFEKHGNLDNTSGKRLEIKS